MVITRYANGTYKTSDGKYGHVNDLDYTENKLDSLLTKYGAEPVLPKTFCGHWQSPVPLLEGLQVYASAYADEPRQDEYYAGTWSAEVDKDIEPDIGFYLDDLWTRDLILATPGATLPFLLSQHDTLFVAYPWPDQSVPRNIHKLLDATMWLLSEIRAGKRVEIGCYGAHGRTGTMIACLLVAQGMPAGKAVKWVREKHCEDAIENLSQARFIGRFSRLLKTGSLPPVPSPTWIAQKPKVKDWQSKINGWSFKK